MIERLLSTAGQQRASAASQWALFIQMFKGKTFRRVNVRLNGLSRFNTTATFHVCAHGENPTHLKLDVSFPSGRRVLVRLWCIFSKQTVSCTFFTLREVHSKEQQEWRPLAWKVQQHQSDCREGKMKEQLNTEGNTQTSSSRLSFMYKSGVRMLFAERYMTTHQPTNISEAQ